MTISKYSSKRDIWSKACSLQSCSHLETILAQEAMSSKISANYLYSFFFFYSSFFLGHKIKCDPTQKLRTDGYGRYSKVLADTKKPNCLDRSAKLNACKWKQCSSEESTSCCAIEFCHSYYHQHDYLRSLGNDGTQTKMYFMELPISYVHIEQERRLSISETSAGV